MQPQLVLRAPAFSPAIFCGTQKLVSSHASENGSGRDLGNSSNLEQGISIRKRVWERSAARPALPGRRKLPMAAVPAPLASGLGVAGSGLAHAGMAIGACHRRCWGQREDTGWGGPAAARRAVSAGEAFAKELGAVLCLSGVREVPVLPQ